MSCTPKNTPEALAHRATEYIQGDNLSLDFQQLADIKRALVSFFRNEFPARARRAKTSPPSQSDGEGPVNQPVNQPE